MGAIYVERDVEMDKKFVIQGEECSREIPNYHDYSYVVDKIKCFLENELNYSVQMYVDEDDREELWDVLTEDICSQSEEIQCLANVYDCVETNVI